jgi:Immunity protein 7
MIEVNGWITLSFRDGVSDHVIDDTYKHVQARTKILDGFNRKLCLDYYNGIAMLTIACAANHKSSNWSEVLQLAEYIAEVADRSYGVIYLRDDEDPGFANAFQVFVIRKGVIRKVVDDHFSPCVPRIEDPFDPAGSSGSI